jgi:exodeoxyribonuclease V
MTQWSPQQARALNEVGRWLKNPEQQVFRLFGYAGTGKTTLAKHLGDSQDGLVHYAAFTGKAALVLRKKGCRDATTIHSFLYLPAPKNRERLRELQAELDAIRPDARKPEGGIDFAKLLRPGDENYQQYRALQDAITSEKEKLRQPAFAIKNEPLRTARGDIELIVVDEVSMVDERLGRDLESTGAKILVLGDPAQLPPVKGGGYFTAAQPDMLLTEVHRQALDSPVLKIATDVREGRHVQLGSYGDSKVCAKTDIPPDEFARAEQLLVGYNATRRGANRRLREMLGWQGLLPMPGEKLVCLRNDHSPNKRLLNGSLWMACDVTDRPRGNTFDLVAESLDEAVTISGSRRVETRTHKYTFMGTEPPDWSELLYTDDNDQPARISEFDFGYALTVHKSQGSQWDEVYIIDEWARNDRRRWLYTAITRAAERVVVARP